LEIILYNTYISSEIAYKIAFQNQNLPALQTTLFL